MEMREDERAINQARQHPGSHGDIMTLEDLEYWEAKGKKMEVENNEWRK